MGVIIHLLLATNIGIARLWKNLNPSLFRDIITELNSHCIMERLLALKNYTFKSFEREWGLWLQHPRSFPNFYEGGRLSYKVWRLPDENSF